MMPLLDPGLLLCLVLVVAFAAVAWLRAYRLYRADREWRDDFARRRARAELAAKGYTVLPADADTSSLLDDSPQGPLPETWRAPCGEVVRFTGNPSDRGPKAA